MLKIQYKHPFHPFLICVLIKIWLDSGGIKNKTAIKQTKNEHIKTEQLQRIEHENEITQRH